MRRDPISVSVERVMVLSTDGLPATLLVRFQARDASYPESAAAQAETLSRKVDEVLKGWANRVEGADASPPPPPSAPKTGVERERERLAALRAGKGA